MYAHYESPVHSSTHQSFSAPTLNAPSSTRIQCTETFARGPFIEQGSAFCLHQWRRSLTSKFVDNQHLYSTSILPREKLNHLLHPPSVTDVKNHIGSIPLATAYHGFEIGCSSVHTKMVANTTIPTVETQTLPTSFFRDVVPDFHHSLAESSAHNLTRQRIDAVLSTRCNATMRTSESNFENSTQFRAKNVISNPLSSEYPRIPSFATINSSIYEKINRRSPYHRSHSQPFAIEGSVHSFNMHTMGPITWSSLIIFALVPTNFQRSTCCCPFCQFRIDIASSRSILLHTMQSIIQQSCQIAGNIHCFLKIGKQLIFVHCIFLHQNAHSTSCVHFLGLMIL